MKSLKESFIKAKDLNNIGAKFDGTFKEGDIILYAESYFYYYTEDEHISAELNIPTKKILYDVIIHMHNKYIF